MTRTRQNQRDSLSSSDINRNLRNIKKNRYIHVKIFTVIVVIVIGWFLYFIFQNNKSGVGGGGYPEIVDTSRPVAHGDSGKKSNIPDSAQSDGTVVSIKPPEELKNFSISAPNLASLRIMLAEESEKIMSSGDWTPNDAKLNLTKNIFSCVFKKKSTPYFKLTLVWGPSNNCESCYNTLLKNPGSAVLLKKEKMGFLYQVTSISR